MTYCSQNHVKFDTGTENIVCVTSSQQELIGILHSPHSSIDRETAIIIVPGAPQYRIGSHRQFLIMARYLTKLGYSVLRIDYPGVGDSTSPTSEDGFVKPKWASQALIDFARALRQLRPQLRACLALGLCDGATAIAKTVGEPKHHSLFDGIILLNPWTHAETQRAKTQLKHYYLNRLFRLRFWTKLLSGQIALSTSLKEIKHKLSQAKGQASTQAGPDDSSQQLLNALHTYRGKQLILLSQHDLVARDFIAINKTQPKSRRLPFTIVTDADHTFSCTQWRNTLLDHISHWLESTAIHNLTPESPQLNRPS